MFTVPFPITLTFLSSTFTSTMFIPVSWISLDELGDKISGEEKAKAEAEIENVKKALEGSDTEAIKNATDKLTTVFYSISEKLYSANAAGAAGAEAAGQTAGPNVDENGNVYDADYKVENDDNK